MLSTQPYKGTRDFLPKEMKLRSYIFNTWRKVCLSFGYEEYDGPLLEPFELFAAKTGEEIVNEQLYYFIDKGGRKVAIRPEMTPTVSRMAAQQIKKQSPTPLKWFSIANFYRYEKPQKGRGREFYQLNVDIFGEESILADAEMLLLNQKLMEAFNAKPEMYQVRVNNRYLIDYLFEKEAQIPKDKIKPLTKLFDKKAKMPEENFFKIISDLGLSKIQIEKIKGFLKFSLDDVKKLSDLSDGAKGLLELFDLINNQKIPSVIYDPTLIRGFDYYDGNVFEQFDMTPGNVRSMFGGGRYDGLISLFINKTVPAVGFAPGDITMKDFLESWNLIPKFETDTKVLVTVFPKSKECLLKSLDVTKKLREILDAECYTNDSTDLTKQIKYADQKGIPFVVIVGPDELKEDTYTLKNLRTQKQRKYNDLESMANEIKKA